MKKVVVLKPIPIPLKPSAEIQNLNSALASSQPLFVAKKKKKKNPLHRQFASNKNNIQMQKSGEKKKI